MNNYTSSPPSKKSKLLLIADDLLRNKQIGIIPLKPGHAARAVVLNTNDIFASLVSTYSAVFSVKWSLFDGIFGGSPPKEEDRKTDIPPWILASRIYISCWIHDLYVSIRHSVRECLDAFEFYHEHFLHQEPAYSDRYDFFLTQLTSSIRPTRIIGTPEDTLYVPVLSSNTNIDWTSSNPFDIPGYNADSDYLHGLLHIMRSCCETEKSKSDGGRPFWLFDWHWKSDECYAWFPMEGNYSMDDVALAFCVGVACSPNLGLSDIDDWQVIHDSDINVSDCNRVRPRSFFGNSEIRTLNRRKSCVIKETGEECYVTDEVDEIQIVDWVYSTLHYQNATEHLHWSLRRNLIDNFNPECRQDV